MEVINGCRDTSACFAAVIRTVGNAMHLEASAVVLLQNAHDAITNGMAAEISRQISHLDLVRPRLLQRTDRRHLGQLPPDEVASALELPRRTDGQRQQIEWWNDRLCG